MTMLRLAACALAAAIAAAPAAAACPDAASADGAERLERLAACGDPDALQALGEALWHGAGVAEDRHAAAAWLRRAADFGQPRAPVLLALYHLDRVHARPGPPDLEAALEAAFWLHLASKVDPDPGRRGRSTLILTRLLDTVPMIAQPLRQRLAAPWRTVEEMAGSTPAGEGVAR